jgi:CO dehydrogenase/acetyl-CoA synthase epsilon subunit
MKKYLMLFVVILCFATAYALDKGKWTGFISDDDCGVKGNNKEHAACAKSCVKRGAKPVFVVGEKVYAISNPEKVEKFIGDEVTITGTITDDVLLIETVKK